MNVCEEVYPGIFRIVERKSLKAVPPVNLYIIAGEDGLLFDGGYGDDESVAKVHEALSYVQSLNNNWNITRVLPSHTHPDHFSGLKQLKNRCGLNVMLTEQMASVLSNKHAYRDSYRLSTLQKYRYSTAFERISELPLQVVFRTMYKKVYGIAFLPEYDETVVHGDVISIDGFSFTVMHAPGHCDDHIMLYEKTHGILLAGDNILRSIYTWLGPPRSDLQAYLTTLQSCLDLPHLTIILSAHGSPITNPRQRIHEIIEYRKLRTKQIYSLVANSNGGITFKKLMDILYPRMKQRRWLARGWVIVTIEYLIHKNALIFEGKKIKVNPGTHNCF